MKMVVKNIGQLFTGERTIDNVDLLIEDGRVKDIGKFPGNGYDARGNAVIPGFVDSHTHLVFFGERSDELDQRLRGKSYLEIAQSGGGITRTVEETRKASEEELFKLAKRRLKRIVRSGTTTVEVKSGYGLTTKDEIKILKVIRRLKDESSADVIATFLGAHVVPRDTKRDSYVQMVIEEMLPQVKEEGLADFCDVFCDEGAFTFEETEKILSKAKDLDLGIKVHAEELGHTGISSLAAEMGAVSCDHLNYVQEDDLKIMRDNDCVAVLLPGTSLFLGGRKPPVDEILKSAVDIAIASDYNPGSCPIFSMPVILALCCLYYKVSIEVALKSATVGGGKAVDRKDVGMLEPNFLADLIVLNKPAPRFLVYNFDQNNIVAIFKKGNIIYHI